MSIYHFLYKTTNLINSKYYLGVHTTNDLNDEYLGSGRAILAAIKKHGKENFQRSILKFFNTREEAFEYEKFIITESVVNDKNTYNLCKGGYGAVGKLIPTNETKQKMSIAQSNRQKSGSPNKGKKLGPRDPEIYLRVKETKAQRTYVPSMLGKKQSKSTKAKQSLAAANRPKDNKCVCGLSFTIQTIERHKRSCKVNQLQLVS